MCFRNHGDGDVGLCAMTRLSSRDREKLYDAEAAKARGAGRGEHPICNICDLPIDGVRQSWDVSHDPLHPNFLNGPVTGIAHRRCNRLHNNQIDTPRYHHIKRVRQRHIGAKVSQRPLPGGRDSPIKIKIGRQVVDRRTGELWRGW